MATTASIVNTADMSIAGRRQAMNLMIGGLLCGESAMNQIQSFFGLRLLP